MGTNTLEFGIYLLQKTGHKDLIALTVLLTTVREARRHFGSVRVEQRLKVLPAELVAANSQSTESDAMVRLVA